MKIRSDEPIRMWLGTVILQCPPCSWGKCVFCGYSRECLAEVQPSTDEFLKQIDCYFGKYGVGEHIEIYNSGSFLDDKQISRESRVGIFRYLKKRGVRSVTIESRPEYIAQDKLIPLKDAFDGELTVAIGLEVADDLVMKNLNKGFGPEDVKRAHAVLDGMGINSRSYILVGPPFVEDPKASALDSVFFAKNVGFTEISLLGAYPMEGSRGYDMWKRGEWVPLEKGEFEEIITSAREIEPNIDYSP